jgi:hypothetical protein
MSDLFTSFEEVYVKVEFHFPGMSTAMLQTHAISPLMIFVHFTPLKRNKLTLSTSFLNDACCPHLTGNGLCNGEATFISNDVDFDTPKYVEF